MLENLQTLRALAALNVVLFHVIGGSFSYGQGVSGLAFFEGWGANGVDVFFVISGFVMVYTQAQNPKSPTGFFQNRVIRIVPIYWILTFVLLGLFFLFPTVFRELKPTFEHAVSSFFFLSRLVVQERPLLYVGWTLECEMLFYTIFAAGLFLRNVVLSFAVPVLALTLICVAGLADLIFLEFVLGMFCALIYLKGWWVGVSRYFLAVGTLLISISAVYHSDADRFFIWGIPAALIVLGAARLPQYRNKIFLYLGAASYSIYLVQIFTIPAFYKFSSRFLTFAQPDLLAFAALAVSAVFGCLVYEYIEKPISRLLKRVATFA